MTLGILAAMHDEVDDLIAAMRHEDARATVRQIGMRDYYAGHLYGQSCVLVLARIGKVAAAATTVTLIREFGVTELVFTGLAGGVGPNVRVGDVVIGAAAVQHDLDARPLFPRHQVPLLDRDAFAADPVLTEALHRAADRFLSEDLEKAVPAPVRDRFAVHSPALHRGLIGSGDQFINAPATVAELRQRLPELLAVEMEGAAVAQVCHEYGIPYGLVRTVSDRADDTAHVDFPAFLSAVASRYSEGILRRLLEDRSRHSQ
ncbi:5'-methylthioadenosine/adenosylhomocysteine nucleosidase [Paracidovorax citrulli]